MVLFKNRDFYDDIPKIEKKIPKLEFVESQKKNWVKFTEELYNYE